MGDERCRVTDTAPFKDACVSEAAYIFEITLGILATSEAAAREHLESWLDHPENAGAVWVLREVDHGQ